MWSWPGTSPTNLGVECEFNRSPKTFNMIIDTVVNHEADIGISVISATLKRAQRVRFANPYLILHPTLVMNRLTALPVHIHRQGTL